MCFYHHIHTYFFSSPLESPPPEQQPASLSQSGTRHPLWNWGQAPRAAQNDVGSWTNALWLRSPSHGYCKSTASNDLQSWENPFILFEIKAEGSCIVCCDKTGIEPRSYLRCNDNTQPLKEEKYNIMLVLASKASHPSVVTDFSLSYRLQAINI
jgi:hypothetical protein